MPVFKTQIERCSYCPL